jgi:hypothetical protein
MPSPPGQAAPSAAPATPPTADAAPPIDRTRDIRWADAHADRVVLLPTAETHPAGTVYLSDYDIAILQVGYAISDRTQITLTTTPPFGEDLVFISDLALKTVIVRSDWIRVAALGAFDGLFGLNASSYVLGRAGFVVQGCLEAYCRSSLNVGTTMLLAGPATMTATGAGVVWRATTALSLLAEAQTLLPLGREAGRINGVALAAGARLGWSRFAIDFAFETFPEARVGDNGFPPILPFLGLTYRFLP